jgi:hypothetical protein
MVERGVHSTITGVGKATEERHYPRWRGNPDGKWHGYSDNRGHTVWFTTEYAAKQWIKELEKALRG